MRRPGRGISCSANSSDQYIFDGVTTVALCGEPIFHNLNTTVLVNITHNNNIKTTLHASTNSSLQLNSTTNMTNTSPNTTSPQEYANTTSTPSVQRVAEVVQGRCSEAHYEVFMTASLQGCLGQCGSDARCNSVSFAVGLGGCKMYPTVCTSITRDSQYVTYTREITTLSAVEVFYEHDLGPTAAPTTAAPTWSCNHAPTATCANPMSKCSCGFSTAPTTARPPPAP